MHTRAWIAPAALALALGCAAPWLGPYAQSLLTKMMIYALFASSLQLLVGGVGLVSLGHAAFFGLGAYAAALAASPLGMTSLPAVLALAMAAAGAYALLAGALSLRTRGVYFIMVTLAFAQMAYCAFHDTRWAGGSDGLFVAARPSLIVGGRNWLDLEQSSSRYALALGLLSLGYAALALLRRSRFGHALAGIRVNEQRMRAAGFSTHGYQLAAFVIAAMLAGLAGALLALQDGVVYPQLLSWHESGAVLLMVILGGTHHPRGAAVGATAFTLLKEFFSSEAWMGAWAVHWPLSLGLCIIVLVVLLPRGVMGALPGDFRAGGLLAGLTRPFDRLRANGGGLGANGGGGRLQADGLTRSFGGLRAVHALSLDVRAGEIHALIGTNGAGKSTLVNLLSGELAPDAGRIRLDGRDITHWAQPRRARAGLGRCYQRSTIFGEFTLLENCRLSAQATLTRPWRLWESAGACRRTREAAQAALHAVGLNGSEHRIAATLSHGQKRQLELALCLAGGPRVLLLDEPLAGMDAHEVEHMLALMQTLKSTHAVLLIEHDMDAVFRVADHITVMVDGTAIASDVPERVRADAQVRLAYLGEAP